MRSAGDAAVPSKRKLSAAHRHKLVKALAKARKEAKLNRCLACSANRIELLEAGNLLQMR
jgi:hypothetical protein